MSPKPKQRVIKMTPEEAVAHRIAQRKNVAGNKLSLLTSVMSFLVPSIMPGFASIGRRDYGAVKAARSPEQAAELQAKAKEKRTDRQHRNILNAMRMRLMPWPEGHPRRG